MPQIPAFLQPYLESEGDSPHADGDPQATPKAEKSKDQCEVRSEPSKIAQTKLASTEVPAATPDVGTLVQNSPSQSTKAVSMRSISKSDSSPTSDQVTEYTDLQQPAPKRPISSSVAFAHDQANPGPTQPYGNFQPMQQSFHSSELVYLPPPPQNDPIATHQALVPHGMLHYSDYGPPPPPPAPEPPQRVQYPPGSESKNRTENAMSLLNRVHYAMPDLHALLDSYHEIYGTLESREAQIRAMEAQRVAEKQQQEKRFVKLEREIESILNKHSAESSQLRMDVDSLDKKCKDLQDRLTSEEEANDEWQRITGNLRAEVKRAAKRHEEDRTTMTQKHSMERDQMSAEHRSKLRSLHDELQSNIRKAEASLSHKEAHFNRKFEEEKQKAEIAWSKQRRDVEESHARTQIDLEEKLEAKQKVVDEERRTYLQAREGWEREREAMIRRWDEERGVLRKTSEEQHKAFMAKHEREKNEMLKQVSQMQHRDEEDDSFVRLQKEIETLRTGWEADRFKFQRTTAEFRSTARTLNEQNSRLQRLTEAFSDGGDSRGK